MSLAAISHKRWILGGSGRGGARPHRAGARLAGTRAAGRNGARRHPWWRLRAWTARIFSRKSPIPAEFRPYTEVELHAKVSGYVKEMKVDIGDRVKAGQLLAVLEVPELHDDFDHAVANATARAGRLSRCASRRTRGSLQSTRIARTSSRSRISTPRRRVTPPRTAVWRKPKSDVEKYQTMVSYTRIVAPFDGVITKRYADPGSLIQAGTASNTQAMPSGARLGQHAAAA